MAIELNPIDPTIYLACGATYFLKEEYNKAIAYFNKAIGLDSKYTDVYYSCGTVYILKNDYEKAIY